tara:strand:+ start:106 stop:399 length:294 start_codon:yes stop_codon:yes gene_type:complete
MQFQHWHFLILVVVIAIIVKVFYKSKEGFLGISTMTDSISSWIKYGMTTMFDICEYMINTAKTQASKMFGETSFVVKMLNIMLDILLETKKTMLSMI